MRRASVLGVLGLVSATGALVGLAHGRSVGPTVAPGVVASPAAASNQAKSKPKEDKPKAVFQLTVRVKGLRNNKGRIALALFRSAEGFPEQDKSLAGLVAKIDKKTAQATFTGLTPGLYAIAMLHDENGNDDMDFNFIGIPLEGYGFSNDASAMFGPPSFSEAAVRLKAKKSVITITAKYIL